MDTVLLGWRAMIITSFTVVVCRIVSDIRQPLDRPDTSAVQHGGVDR